MKESIDRDALKLFADSMQRYGQQQYSFERRREWLAKEGGFSTQVWRDQTDMGWLALHIPEADGGFGGHLEAVCALMRCAGEYLFLEPLFGHGILCAQLLASCATEPLARESLNQLCAGNGLYALAFCEDQPGECDVPVRTLYANGLLSGSKTLVLHGDVATQLLVLASDGASGAQSWYQVDAGQAGVERKSYRLLDGRGTASLMFRNAVARRIGPPGEAQRLLANLLGVARLALCAEAYGVILALNRITLAYLKERHQFGKPIGANQALQHRMVELYMLEQEVAAVLKAALRAAAGTDAVVARAVAAGALAQTLAAGRIVSHEAVQMHGGIGTTDALPVSHYFKRIMVINRLLGDRDAHLDTFANAAAGGIL